MRAQVFHDVEDLRLEERPRPVPAADQVLVRVKAVGICGSDASYFFGRSPLETPDGKGPIILGHEFTGVVEEAGDLAAARWKPGDRVVVNPVQHCGVCRECAAGRTHMCPDAKVHGARLEGAYADFALSADNGLFALPEGVDFLAGCCIEPLACAVRAMNRLEIEPGQFLVVVGPGPIGLMMVQLAKRAYGAGRVALVGTNDFRLEKGAEMGADHLLNIARPESPHYVKDAKRRVAELTGGRLADRVMLAAGSEGALDLAIGLGGNCSITVLFGLPPAGAKAGFPSLDFYMMDKQLRASKVAPGVWPQTLELLEKRFVDLRPLVTHTVPLEGLRSAFYDLMRDRKGDPLKAAVVF